MNMSPDEPLWQWEFLILNRTILFTWLVMGLLTCGSWFITRRLSTSARLSRGQNLLEVLVSGLRNQIQEVSQQDPGPYLPFVGTLFLFIVVSNILSIVPGYHAPTSSISTTAALATCVFVAVPLYGIASQGLVDYLKQYIRPSILMLPFNIIGELSRTLALAVRLYGNIMSGSVIGAILLGFVPLFVPILMQAFGLLTGIIQAYIFSVLAMVYIASATQVSQAINEQPQLPQEHPKQNT
ncbi:F0F1 ATP synthase subunit A [Gimesia sp.]|uniref:F0F1 ATP synthase subunit A n=1 Tax=Gimesia sp. TaxID=2024833 RepID=UPI003A8DD9DF